MELRNKKTFEITEKQARLADIAWEHKSIIHLNGNRINTTEIIGIWDKDTWLELHPEKRPQEHNTTSKFNPQLLDTVKASPDSPWRQCVMMNSELLKKGLLPKYIVENNSIIEKEHYWS